MNLGLMLAGISAFGMVVCAPAFAQDKPFQGVTVNVITQTGAIQEWELDKARNAARRSLAGSLGSSLQRAILLSRYTVFYNDPGVLNTRYDRVVSLTIADLQRVARQYLVPANRAVIVTVPAKQAPAAPKAGRLPLPHETAQVAKAGAQ